MLVRDWMAQDPLVVAPATSVAEALWTMGQHRVRHLPVVENDLLVGIVTQTDLLQASPSPATSLSAWERGFLLARRQVGEVMTKQVIVVDEECPLEEAALVMAEHKIGSLPVVRGRRLAGILTETDLFNVFTEQLGARHSGVRLTLAIRDARGELSRMAARIAAAGGNIIRLTTLPARDPEYQVVTLRVKDAPRAALIEALSGDGVEILDVRETQGWGTDGFLPYHWRVEG
jgi:acetoin utilization protein AcuB